MSGGKMRIGCHSSRWISGRWRYWNNTTKSSKRKAAYKRLLEVLGWMEWVWKHGLLLTLLGFGETSARNGKLSHWRAINKTTEMGSIFQRKIEGGEQPLEYYGWNPPFIGIFSPAFIRTDLTWARLWDIGHRMKAWWSCDGFFDGQALSVWELLLNVITWVVNNSMWGSNCIKRARTRLLRWYWWSIFMQIDANWWHEKFLRIPNVRGSWTKVCAPQHAKRGTEAQYSTFKRVQLHEKPLEYEAGASLLRYYILIYAIKIFYLIIQNRVCSPRRIANGIAAALVCDMRWERVQP